MTGQASVSDLQQPQKTQQRTLTLSLVYLSGGASTKKAPNVEPSFWSPQLAAELRREGKGKDVCWETKTEPAGSQLNIYKENEEIARKQKDEENK